MKALKAITLIGIAGLLLAPAASARLTVEWVEPERFTDFKMYGSNDAKGRAFITSELEKHLEREVERFLPEGYSLEVRFTDVDLAGDYEPWRGHRFHDVRIIRSIYRPKMNFSFVVTDGAGAVVKEDEVVLVDMNFLNRLHPGFRSDSFVYEKSMLTDWARSTLRGL